MNLYRPPLRENSRIDSNSAPLLNQAIKGRKIEYYYTGQRIGKDLIELKICTLIEDNSDNLFLRFCTYSCLKHNWKVVIIDQVEQQLMGLEVEKGFIKSETRYLEITPEQHFGKEKFESLYNCLKEK